MGSRSRPADTVKVTEQSTEKKKGLGDWMNIIKPPNEEKDHWVSAFVCLGQCVYLFVLTYEIKTINTLMQIKFWKQLKTLSICDQGTVSYSFFYNCSLSFSSHFKSTE